MSVDHSLVISSTLGCDLRINISNLDSSPQLAERLLGNIYAYDKVSLDPRFTCQFGVEDLRKLFSFLNQYSVIRESTVGQTGRIIEVTEETESLIRLFDQSNKEAALVALESIVSTRLSQRDINTILGRKSAFQRFQTMLADQEAFTELDWQEFLQSNDWIFGYGLIYKYLGILQREAHVSGTDLGGRGSVIADFMLSDRKFIKLVELKRPSTPLFESDRNRSDSWRLSKDLTYAVSQILAQKANWEHESHEAAYTSEGKRIDESTIDPECILIIGSSRQFEGEDRDQVIKKKTFELFRRNLRNIDILLYDELFERAAFLVASDHVEH